MFVATKSLHAKVDVSRALEAARGNIKNSAKKSLDYYELKTHTPWFEEGC
jgi:hypothetical protein